MDNFSFLDNMILYELVVGKNEGVIYINFFIVYSFLYVIE